MDKFLEITGNNQNCGDGDNTLPALEVAFPERIFADPNSKCIEPTDTWTRPPADLVADLSGMNLRHTLLIEQESERHGTYLRPLANALVFGHHHLHSFLTNSFRFDCQDIKGYRTRLDYHITHHPGRDLPIPQIVRDGDAYRVDMSRVSSGTITPIGGTVYFGTPTEPLNWGMWLLQAVPAAWDFVHSRSADRFFCYVDCAWQRALLDVMGVANDAIIHQELGRTYCCDSVILRQYSAVDLVPSPAERDLYARLAHEFTDCRAVTAKKKIFVSRLSVTKRHGGRALQNENELIECLLIRGFQIVEPESMSFQEQMQLFQEAEIVIGLGGAGLFNVVFCRPGTRVVSIESSTAFVHGHALLFAALGHRFAFVFGRQDPNDDAPVHKRWSIDVTGAMEAIDSLM